jgi:CSLREA domain-containing protein
MCATVVLLGTLALAQAASAATFRVNSTVDSADANTADSVCLDILNRCTLRAAIEQANALGGPDQVILPPGTYAIGNELPVSSNIVLDGTGTPSNTRIQPGGVGRIFNVAGGGTFDLRDVTVRNGVLSNTGGGIQSHGTLVLRRVALANNEANNANGGGLAIIAPAGNTTILNTTIGSPGNRAGGSGATQANGGGIYHEDGTLTIRNSTIAGNRVSATPPAGSAAARGGAIYSLDTFVIENSVIRSNRANVVASGGFAEGAGLVHEGGSLTMRRTTVADNAATASGAVARFAGIRNLAAGLIEDSTISGNTAAEDAGIFHSGLGPTLTMRRTTVSGNQPGGILANERLVLENSTVSGNGSGDGIRTEFGRLTIRSSTIAGHTGGTGLLVEPPFSDTVSVKASILSGNGTNCDVTSAATFVSGGGNVENGDDCGFGAAGDQPNTNPLLGPLQSNGGPTQTQAIARTSPARDAVTSGCPPPSTDQRGVARPRGPRCDSGAFEFDPEAPQLVLSGKAKQKAKKLTLDVSCGPEPCSVELGGKGKVPTRAAVAAKAKKLKLKPDDVDVAGGESLTVRLKFKKNRKTVKKVNSLLKRGGRKARKAKVVVSGTATGIGGTDTESKKIKLKR